MSGLGWPFWTLNPSQKKQHFSEEFRTHRGKLLSSLVTSLWGSLGNASINQSQGRQSWTSNRSESQQYFFRTHRGTFQTCLVTSHEVDLNKKSIMSRPVRGQVRHRWFQITSKRYNTFSEPLEELIKEGWWLAMGKQWFQRSPSHIRFVPDKHWQTKCYQCVAHSNYIISKLISWYWWNNCYVKHLL